MEAEETNGVVLSGIEALEFCFSWVNLLVYQLHMFTSTETLFKVCQAVNYLHYHSCKYSFHHVTYRLQTTTSTV